MSVLGTLWKRNSELNTQRVGKLSLQSPSKRVVQLHLSSSSSLLELIHSKMWSLWVLNANIHTVCLHKTHKILSFILSDSKSLSMFQ